MASPDSKTTLDLNKILGQVFKYQDQNGFF